MTKIMNRRAALGALAGAGGALATSPALMAAPEQRAKIATAEEIAELAFKPWAQEDASPEAAREWLTCVESHFNAVMLAAATLRKTKPELEGVVRGLSEESIAEDTIDSIIQARETFGKVASILECAEIRMMSAYASAFKKDDPAGFAEA